VLPARVSWQARGTPACAAVALAAVAALQAVAGQRMRSLAL